MGEISITYRDEPPGVRDGTTPSCSDLQDFASLEAALVIGNKAPQHATFEDGYWILGKDYRLFPDTPVGLPWGVFSRQMCNFDGMFTTPITLVLTLDGLYSAVAMSLEFDAYGPTWCSELTIDWWRAGAVISSQDYQPNGWQYTCYNTVTGFDLVTLTFRKMSAGHRFLKLPAWSYGITRVFDSDELFEIDLFQDTDLISDEVAVNTLDFVLRNKSAIAYMFQRKQSLELAQNGSLLGVYYIQTSERLGGNRYSIHAVDLVGLAEMSGQHNGGIYSGEAAEAIADDILGNIPWEMQESLRSVPIYGYLPIASRRDNLQQLAFALGAMVRTSHLKYIEISRPDISSTVTDYGAKQCYENGKVISGTLVTAVRVAAHSYELETERLTLYEDILDGQTELTFSEPRGSLAITGGTIVESGANYAVIIGTGATVTLTGIAYKHTKRIYTQYNPLRGANDVDNPVSYEDMTLVSTANVADVLASCYAHNMRLNTIEGKVLTGTEKPGDYVSILTEYEGVRNGHLKSLDYTISGKMAADAVILADA